MVAGRRGVVGGSVSRTTLIAVYPGEYTECISEFGNSWGSAPYVWGEMLQRYLCKEYFALESLKDLWPYYKRQDLPFHHRSVLMMTFDRAYIAKKDYARAAKDIRAFLKDFPPNPEYSNHWREIAAIFDSDPPYPGIGFWMTSVSENPFNGTWNENTESYDPPDWNEIYSIYDVLDKGDSMKVSKDFTVITVLDSHGNTWMGAAGDIDNDLLQVRGLKYRDGDEVSSRMNLATIIGWSQENGMTCRVSKHEITTEI